MLQGSYTNNRRTLGGGYWDTTTNCSPTIFKYSLNLTNSTKYISGTSRSIIYLTSKHKYNTKANTGLGVGNSDIYIYISG